MKQKIKTGLTLLFAMLLMGSAYAQSGKLFVYGNDGSKQQFTTSEVQKLTFTENAMIVNKTDGTTFAVAFAGMQYFNLGDDATAIKPAPVKPEIAAWFDASGTLNVKSAAPMTSIALFNLQGLQLQKTAVDASEVSLTVTNCPAGIYLLQVMDGNGCYNCKVLKR